ncbi:MAG TPA: Ig-like domain-containing protein, partial [Anaerolineales bacterium]
TDAGEVLNVAAPGVLGNDSDADSDSLEAVKVTNPSNGILVLNKSGSFSYTPNEGFVGTDSFTYKANDGTVNSNTAMVTITVTPLPTIDLIKDVTPTSRLEPGGVFTYTLTITNTSDEQVKIISLTDTYKLPAACKNLVNQWIPASGNLSCSYEITHTDVGSYSNTAEVTVEDNEANSASDTANTEVTVREKPRLYLPLITR